ncbi:hypothetical protein [Alcaligenes sp. WGS1538]|uniref:hypothetical protein n=1 Tax=Alcaligenes sp. WGS1538 TaxID=3366811 RepID=UPI00372D6F40
MRWADVRNNYRSVEELHKSNRDFVLRIESELMLVAERAAEDASIAAPVSAEPVAWTRAHPDGSLTTEILLSSAIENVRKQSGAWVPLCPAPVAAQAQQEADKVDAERYRAWRDALITGKTSEHDFIRLVADSLPTSVGVSRRPTVAE